MAIALGVKVLDDAVIAQWLGCSPVANRRQGEPIGRRDKFSLWDNCLLFRTALLLQRLRNDFMAQRCTESRWGNNEIGKQARLEATNNNNNNNSGNNDSARANYLKKEVETWSQPTNERA